jgi:cellulose biosynthesis protein BcsQ
VNDSAAEPGQVVAFYSFKGGTGRSMALANVAYILARSPDVRGPVLMIDWDLEAPGLHRYLGKQLYGAFRGDEELQKKSPGLIDLFVVLRDRLDKLDADAARDFKGAAELLQTVSLDDYIIETDVPRLSLLKAGSFENDYASTIGTFEWLSLYRRCPYLLRAFAARLAENYRYVLVDSRTGLTDTAGICTMLLPEILVTVFTPNRQSLDGVIDLLKEAARYRSRSDDLRPLMIYPLPSRIEASEPTLRQQWRFGDANAGVEGFQRAFEQAFKEIYRLPACDLGPYFDDIQVQHVPRYAYGEELAVVIEKTRDRLSLTRSYQRVAARLSSGQLPWEEAATAETGDAAQVLPQAGADLDSVPSEDQTRKRAADAYLRRIADPVDRLRKIGRRSRAIYGSLYLAGIILAAAAAVAIFSNGASVAVEGILVLAVAVILALSPVLWAASNKLSTQSYELDREIKAFKEGMPPYETADALNRLTARIDPILASRDSTGAAKKSGKIYISYRRADSADAARRIYDWLRGRFGPERLVIDTDDIRPGMDFRAALEEIVSSASVMLVIIGRNWLSDRLQEPSDPIRFELELALRMKIAVIPILIDDAQMPSASNLPSSIQDLAFLNALVLNRRLWEAGMARLVNSISLIAAPPRSSRSA